MRRDELDLDLERRRLILELVQVYPGLHLSEIARRLSWSPMLAEYHLHLLERHELLTSLEEGNYHRYYAKIEREGMKIDALGAQEKRVLALLRHPVRLHLAVFLATQPARRNKEIAKELALSRPAVSYQLAKLAKAGLVAKDAEDLYRLAEPALITRLLLIYRPPQDQVERFRDLWDRLSGTTPIPPTPQALTLAASGPEGQDRGGDEQGHELVPDADQPGGPGLAAEEGAARRDGDDEP